MEVLQGLAALEEAGKDGVGEDLAWAQRRPQMLLPLAAGRPQLPTSIRVDSRVAHGTLRGWTTSQGYTLLTAPLELALECLPPLARRLLARLNPLLGATLTLGPEDRPLAVRLSVVPQDALLPAAACLVRVDPLEVTLSSSGALLEPLARLRSLGGAVPRLPERVSAGVSGLEAVVDDGGGLTAAALDLTLMLPARTRVGLTTWGSAALHHPERLDWVVAVPGATLQALGVRGVEEDRGVAMLVTGSPLAPTPQLARIAGQEELKLALLLNVVDPSIGGALIMGDRGTGKSVAVRALVDVLPEIQVVKDDPFNSSPTDPGLMGPEPLAALRAGIPLETVRKPTPLVELPLGATEDRICGTIDVEKALSEGIKAYEPGLLARSGNPAEGELRPQLLDRFGLSVSVGTLQETSQRTRMVLDRLAFEGNPAAFLKTVAAEQEALVEQLERARQLLPEVTVSRDIKLKISELCSLLDTDGIRGDIVLNRAVRAAVALQGRKEVVLEDVVPLASMALSHRLRKDPLDPLDNNVKVALALRRMLNPKAVEKEEEAKKKQAAEAASKPKKAGAWGGLPR
ncbi:Magnesium-chelatase subunit ChlI [Auxenochlorella protothecoides]|uniref:magnesium chelatase n=1 Tax=Auxenochlorella protothecoides TaxID=3075 RepID=A0A087SDK7_AUXPR|nr:Magnesium-chelatase subunit ChlI [Auxenochlorella protothecoides]KFM23811.1 Magnesium-chelatase subunit ChlI [Auxenochlorella protothecoides]